jgi:O-methyltransferase
MITLELTEIASIVLVLVLLFLGFKILETKWSYKISKPHKWDTAIEKGEVSDKLKSIEKNYRDKVRFYTFWLQIERLKNDKVSGAFAELGVYRGETAQFIHEMDNSRVLHLFDTFEGFDQKDLQIEKSDDEKYSMDNFSDTSLEQVKEFIQGNEKVNFYPGFFPESVKGLNEDPYAFVHLDADLYQPTIAALRYFYPRLSSGGVIIIHDYNHTWDGIRKAINEFSSTISETVIEIADWQGSVMIVKNYP